MQEHSKIYVAGHQGLVGRSLVDLLEKNGFKNIVTRTHAELDLINQAAVESFFKKEKPDYVFLAAAKVGGIRVNDKYRADFIYQNLMIQANVIHQSYQSQVKKLLFFGSSCAYPKNSPEAILEDDLLTGALEYTSEPYAVAKIAGLRLCESYNQQYGTNFLSVIPATVYGPNDNFDLENSHVIPALIRKIYLAKCLMEQDWSAIKRDLGDDVTKEGLQQLGISPSEIQLWGSGNPRRDFIYADDLAEACLFLMSQSDVNAIETSGSERRNMHVNIGSGNDISMRDLAELIAKVVGYGGNLRFDATKPDGALRKLQDTTRLNNLGWKPKTELIQGLSETYRCYRTSGSRRVS